MSEEGRELAVDEEIERRSISVAEQSKR